jgi:hypothetical protein
MIEMTWDNITSFLVGIIFTIAIIGFTILIFKLEFPQRPIIYAENRTPDSAYVDIVSRTEYYALETGQVIIRTSDYLGNPLNASCNVSIVYPNKTFWIIDSSLSSSSIAGNYYKEVTIPDVLGVYEYYFVCNVSFKNNYVIIKKSSTFHVSIAYEKLQEILDRLDAINSTLIQINQSINNLEINMNNNFTYTNSLIQNITCNVNMTGINENITNQFNDLRSYLDIQFYNLEQKWINFLDQLLTRLLGTSKQLQDVVGQTTGVSSGCSLLNRILGNCQLTP